MTLHEEQKKVQKAMESTLSGLQEDPWLTQRVLANAKGEEPVKKKLSTALVLCIVLGLAIIGTAYAILSSSQVAEFFGQHWNQDLGTRLQEGKIAQIGESVTVGDAVITLDEIVYRDRGIYGVGTVRPVHEGDVLFAMDTADLLMSSHEEELHPEIDPSSPVIQEYYAALSRWTLSSSCRPRAPSSVRSPQWVTCSALPWAPKRRTRNASTTSRHTSESKPRNEQCEVRARRKASRSRTRYFQARLLQP